MKAIVAEAHVWNASLDVPPERLQELSGHLCQTELDRAARFRFARDRDRFTAARGTLRELLSKYTKRPAAALEFSSGPKGKPAVNGIHFNISHSAGIAVIATCHEFEVGVDVEQVRLMPELDQMARQVLSTAELEKFLALDAEAQSEAFFHIWTRKEAITKALGLGLSMDFREVVDDSGAMSLYDLQVPEGFVGSLAIVAPLGQTRYIPCGCC